MSERSMEQSIWAHMNPDAATSGLEYEDLHAMYKQIEDSRTGKADLYRKFDRIWTDLWAQLEEPLQLPRPDTDDFQRSGFTGHRIVQFEDRMGRAALGFQLIQNGGDHNRIISAFRRKVYTESRRRVNYTATEFHLFKAAITNGELSESLVFDIGVMRVWANKFLEAERHK